MKTTSKRKMTSDYEDVSNIDDFSSLQSQQNITDIDLLD